MFVLQMHQRQSVAHVERKPLEGEESQDLYNNFKKHLHSCHQVQHKEFEEQEQARIVTAEARKQSRSSQSQASWQVSPESVLEKHKQFGL